jgi:hypothetical protein
MLVKVTIWDPTVQAFLAAIPARRRAAWLALAAAYWMRTSQGQATARQMSGQARPDGGPPRRVRARSPHPQPNPLELHPTMWDEAALPPPTKEVDA